MAKDERLDKKALLIVDPQVDFIIGSLPVPGAEVAMDSLAKFIKEQGINYSHIILTADRHPINHCSFTQNGGIWPRHCVADSIGAAIWQPIMDALYTYPGKISVFHKGELADREEYSFFKSDGSTEGFKNILSTENIKEIDICGLAGDICVANTFQDGLEVLPGIKFNLLSEFSPSIY